MDTSTYTLDDQVDIVLHKIALAPSLTLPLNELYDVTIMSEGTYNLDHFMIEKGLIKIAKDGRTITGKGLEISNFGGWIAYQRQLRKEKNNIVSGMETVLKKYEREIASLKKEIEKHKEEIHTGRDKEASASMTIKNLIEQNKSAKLLMFMCGIVVGLLASSFIWYFIFN